MTAVRRHIIRRIHRETGKSLPEILLACRSLTALEIAQRYLGRVAVPKLA